MSKTLDKDKQLGLSFRLDRRSAPMIYASFKNLIRRRTATCLLVLLALGQLAVAAHALDHGIADHAQHCATCVHLDQGSQVPASFAAIALRPPASAGPSVVAPDPAALARSTPFDARAPPL